MNIKCRICEVNKDTSEFHKGEKSSRCKDCERRRKREERIKRSHYESDRRSWLKKTYNITLEDYNEMLSNQKGLCAICSKPGKIKKGKLCIDHDHTTGKVRGLLCHSCNTALGLLDDNIENLKQSIKYLENGKN